MNDIALYPEPPNPQAARFKRGDTVVTNEGLVGMVQGPEDFEGYDYNKPSDKWELVHWHDLTIESHVDHSETWISKAVIKKLND
jgi:hypothetical protein